MYRSEGSKQQSELSILNIFSDVQARPERLISRLRTISVDDAGPKILVVRQPKGPDGSKGFSSELRTARLPGVVSE